MPCDLSYPQLNNLAVEQDIYNLKRDCEEKNTTIKELTTQLNYSEVANSKVILIYILFSLVRILNFSFSLFNPLTTPTTIWYRGLLS